MAAGDHDTDIDTSESGSRLAALAAALAFVGPRG